MFVILVLAKWKIWQTIHIFSISMKLLYCILSIGQFLFFATFTLFIPLLFILFYYCTFKLFTFCLLFIHFSLRACFELWITFIWGNCINRGHSRSNQLLKKGTPQIFLIISIISMHPKTQQIWLSSSTPGSGWGGLGFECGSYQRL